MHNECRKNFWYWHILLLQSLDSKTSTMLITFARKNIFFSKDLFFHGMASFLVNDNLAVKKETKRIIEYIITAVFWKWRKKSLRITKVFKNVWYISFKTKDDPYILLPLL